MPISNFVDDLCTDVHAEIFGFLPPCDQAHLRSVSHQFWAVFNHAFQRGYVAAAIHEWYVPELKTMFEDYDDGEPMLRVAPVDPRRLVNTSVGTIRSANITGDAKGPLNPSSGACKADTKATLFVNARVALQVLRVSDREKKNSFDDDFLCRAPFKAVHVFDTQTLQAIGNNFLAEALSLKSFSIATPSPSLTLVGDGWLAGCRLLTHFDVSGCSALAVVKDNWLRLCTKLATISFNGCRQLKIVGRGWMWSCKGLTKLDASALVSLETVGPDWLLGCTAVKELDFSCCRALRSVDSCWMTGCTALHTLDLRNCRALEHVGSHMATTCPPLKRVVVSKGQALVGPTAAELEEFKVVVDEEEE